MTSKEALLDLVKYVNLKDCENKFLFYDKIEKDLEVLEIIKHNLYIQNNCDTAHVTFRQILCNIPSFNNDFQKIKEWLENDK